MLKDIVKKIKEFGKVVDSLIELGLKLGNLIAIIKMILDGFN